MTYEIIRLTDVPTMKITMSQWFHEKWGIPLEAYEESMDSCLLGKGAVPEWYVAVENGHIIGGAGVIENDFHDRCDLTPNVCALYVEENYRGRGIAGAILEYICRDMSRRQIDTLYLVTDHTSFYERYGWKYFTDVVCEGEIRPSRMYIHKLLRKK
ncbi:MAG: GNAT family N-acetyltransferase [Ruminococcaceae bacterium]|nr:GNAT family N-acetyltransferase [Oscillospiraceae bacterium]